MPAQIINTSRTRTINWRTSGLSGQQAGLAAFARQLNAVATPLLATLPRANAQAVLTNGLITGGPYAYGGNQQIATAPNDSISFTTPIYNDSAIHQAQSYLGNGVVRYTTLFRPDFFALSGDFQNIASIGLSYNNAAGAASTLNSEVLTVRGLTWKAWYYSVPGNSQLTIRHIYLTPADPKITFTSFSAGEGATLANLPYTCRIHHLWFCTSDSPSSTAGLSAFVRSFLEFTHAPADFIRTEPAFGTLTPGAKTDVQISMDSAGLPPVIYDNDFVISEREADADAPGSLLARAHMEVVPPQFTASDRTEPLAFMANEIRHTDKILLTAAEGFTFGQITAGTDAAWIRAVPSENRTGEVDLNIDTTGMAPGTYVANVTIEAGLTVRTVKITIRVVESQVFRMVADPARPRVYTLQSSYTYDQSLYTELLVLDSTTGEQVRQIGAQGSSDIAISRDATRLYTVFGSPARLGWFDLARMVKSSISFPPATFGSNELIAQMVPGPGEALYLISATDRRLVVQNSATGALIQTLGSPGEGLLFGKICLSADGKSLLANVTATASYTGPATPQVFHFDIQPDGSLKTAATQDTPVVVTPSLPATVVSDIADLTVTQDGRYTVSGDRAYEAGQTATSSVSFPSTLRCMSPGGEFALGIEGLYSSDGRHLLSDLTHTGLLSDIYLSAAITPEGRIFFASNSKVRSFDPRALLGNENAGYFIAPAEGAGVNIPETFCWLPVEGAREYRVYASRDAAALQSDTPATGTEISHTSFYKIANPVAAAMTRGETWYWRVDAAAPQGRVRGEVHRFTLNPLATDRDRLDVTAVRGCVSQPAQISILSGPASWTAKSDQPWLKVETPAGSDTQPVKMTVNTTLLTTDSGSATLILQSAGATARIPVRVQTLRGSPVDVQIAEDYDAAFAIVQTDEATNFHGSYLLRIDPATGTLLNSLPLDFKARYLRFSPDQSRLGVESYVVSNIGSNSLEIFDTASLGRQSKLVSYIGYSSSIPASAAALGPEDKAVYAHRLIHYPDNTILATRASSRVSESPISAFSADGRYLYAPLYHGLAKLDATSPTLSTVKSVTVEKIATLTGSILTSRDPGHMVYGGISFDTDLNVTAINANGGQPVQAVNRNGTLGITATSLVHIPAMKQIPSFAPGQQFNFPVFNDRRANILSATGTGSNIAYQVTSYQDQIAIDQSTLTPGVPDGALIASDLTLSWNDLASAGAYRVFMSTSLSEIEKAEPGDPTELGLTYGTTWALASPLQANTTYYWKLILEGPAGHVSSAAWSFHSSDFKLSKDTLSMVGPLECAPITRQIDLSVPTGRAWSVATNTPWLTVSGSGTNSGKITFTVDSTGFSLGTYAGSATLTVGNERLVIPVTFKSFDYKIVQQIGDPDRSYAHLLVYPEQEIKTTEPAYLVKIDMNTHRAVDAVDLGQQFLTYTGDLYLSVHPEDDRVYVYSGTTRKIYGCNRSTYLPEKILAVADLPGFVAQNWNGAIYPAGLGRMAALFQGVGIKLYSTDTGALISERNFSAAENYFALLSRPGGTRIYGFSKTETGGYNFPASFDISSAGAISDGPMATRRTREYSSGPVNFGLTSGGRALYFQNTLYDLDLNATGDLYPSDFLNMITGDGSIASMGTSSGSTYLASTDGLTRYPRAPYLSSSYFTSADPFAARFGTFAYFGISWLEFMEPSAATLPIFPGVGWYTFGVTTWRPDPARPGVLTVSGLKTPASFQNQASSTLSITPPVAGRLTFEWRTSTNGRERQELRLNGEAWALRFNNTLWENRQIDVSAGSTVEWVYLIDNVTGADPSAMAELRNVTFTPAVSAAAASVVISPITDRDGDGFTDLMEAALGTDADSSASRPVAGLVMNGTSATYVYERPASSTYDYTVQISQDLVTWQDVPAENASAVTLATAAPGGSARQRVSMPLPAMGSKSFTRLKITDSSVR